jgi:translocation and assembly module TamB
MASEETKQRKPRRRTRLLLVLAPVTLLVLLPLLLASWLLASESGARAAFSLADRLSGGTVQATGLQGRILGPLRIGQLTLTLPDNRITLHDLNLAWLPSDLLQQRLHLTSLHIGRIDIIGKIDSKPKPPSLPERIALPLALQIDEARIDGGAFSRGPVTLLSLGALAFDLDFDGSRYRLGLRELRAGSALETGSVATRFSGEATLAVTKPYALQARFSSSGNASLDQRAFGASGDIVLSGTLAELTARADLMVNQTPLKGKARLRPFSEQPLGAAQVTARMLDLSRLDATLPQTALDIDFNAQENGSGELAIRNRAAGLYNERKLPLTALDLAFRQSPGRFDFERISAALGSARQPAGNIDGSGRYADGALTLNLHTAALDVRRLDGRARATRLAGRVDLRRAAGKQEFDIALSEPVGRQRLSIDARGVLADNELAIERAELRAGSGSLSATAALGLTGRQAFQAQGRFNRFRLREFGDFPALPELDLNARFSLHGARQPQADAELEFAIEDSKLAGQPLSGAGRAQLHGEQLIVPEFRLASGANRLSVEGRLSQGDARLVFALDAPQLAQLGPGFGGSLRANGTARGTVKRPRIELDWNAANLRGPGPLEIEALQGKTEIALDRGRPFIIDLAAVDLSARGMRHGDDRLASIALQGRFAPRPDAPLALNLRAGGIAAAGLRAERFSATAGGTTARHTIEMSLNEPGQDWLLKAIGNFSLSAGAPYWQGELGGFDARGRFNARLAVPAALSIAGHRVELDHFLLDTDSGRVTVERFARDAEGIVTRGKLERMQLAQLLRHASPAPPVKTDLQFSGEWDVRIADTISGTLALRRDQGDVTVLGGAPVTLGLRNLNASASATGGRLALRLQAEGSQFGVVDLTAGTQTGSGPDRLRIASEAPVSGHARIDMPSLAWVGPLLSPSLIADGRLQGDVTLDGRFGDPRLTGRIGGEALRVSLTDLGIDLRQGTLQSEFQGERLQINQLSFQGAQGRVTVAGPIDLGGNVRAQLALRAERFALLNRADRRVVVSGDSRLDLQDQHAKVSGNFIVNSGFFDLGSADKPQLSDDVVIVGREKKAPQKFAAAVDIGINLGDGVSLKGRGLDALLTGNVRIASKEGETPQATGTLSIAKGTFSAYGRELAIEQGLLRFTGSLSNPSLDILAMRRGQEVEAGVSVRGAVLAPRITLVSEPSVPDAEKLSWLVLGRSLSSTGQADAGALQAAAAALLSDSARAGVQSRIASAFGLDTFSVGTTNQDNLQQRIITLGKQVSSRLYLSYKQGLDSAGNAVQLRYTLSPKLSVEAEAGTRSALSLFYNIAFD